MQSKNSQQITNTTNNNLEQSPRSLGRDSERVVAPLESDLATHKSRPRSDGGIWIVAAATKLVVDVVAVAVQRRVGVEEDEPQRDEHAVREPQHDQEDAGPGVRALPSRRPAVRVQRRRDALSTLR